MEHFLLELLEAGRLPARLEFVLNVRDNPQQPSRARQHAAPVFSFSKDPSLFSDVQYPAWTFWSGGPAIKIYPRGLGRWDLMREALASEADKWPWADKEDKLFFRGSRTSQERDPLVALARREPELVDAKFTPSGSKRVNDKAVADGLGPLVDVVPLEDHCRYKYLVNFRGVAASFRFKHLFLCGSLVFHVGQDWTEFFYQGLKPWVHYVPVSKDMSDLEEKLRFANDPSNADLVEGIARRGRDFVWEHLEQRDVADYWALLLGEYHKLIEGWAPTIERREGTIEVRGRNDYGPVWEGEKEEL